MTTGILHRTRHRPVRRTLFGYITQEHPLLDRIQNAISATTGLIAAFAILAMVILTLTEMFARLAFAAPLGWTLPFIEEYLMTAAAFFGMVTAYRTGAHVAVVSFYHKVPPRARKLLTIFGALVVLSGMAMLGVAGATSSLFSLSINEAPLVGSAALTLPSWFWRSMVPVAMLLGIVIVLIDLYREFTSPSDAVTTDYDTGDDDEETKPPGDVDEVLENVEYAEGALVR